MKKTERGINYDLGDGGGSGGSVVWGDYFVNIKLSNSGNFHPSFE